MKKEVEVRGTPPYVVHTATSWFNMNSQKNRHNTYLGAIKDLLFITVLGKELIVEDQAQPYRITDGNGDTVFTADNEEDVKYLKEIGKIPDHNIVIIPRRINKQNNITSSTKNPDV